MRYILRLVSWLVLLAAPGLIVADTVPPVDFSFFWRLAPSVFKIEAYSRNGGVSVGSGVLVRPGLVVTNCHVTRQAVSIQIVKQGSRWDAHAQVSDVEHDVCLLEAPEITGTVASMNGSRPHVGQRVIAVGYVGGLAPQLSGGEVQALYRYDGGQVIQSTAWFNSGASGGGLFDQDGELIGIIAFRHQGGDYHFALPVDWIYSNLDLEQARAVTPLGQGVAFWQRNGDGQPYFLKAAALEAKHDWPALRELAEKWSAVETGNCDAWLSLGLANARLGDLDRAVSAFVEAIHSDLENSEAWFSLGLAYAALGERQRVDEVQRVLLTLNEDLAAKLNRDARIR
ncbi:MAG: tetratricopeptide repeat-containing serine protease family protein [Sulfurifustis sp.]